MKMLQQLSKNSSTRSGSWKWLAGSAAAFGIGPGDQAQAVPTQINLVNNQVSLDANNINPDVTGDGISDLPNLNVIVKSFQNFTRTYSSTFLSVVYSRVAINSGTGSATSVTFAGKFFGAASFFSSNKSNLARTMRIGSNSPDFFYVYAGNSTAPQKGPTLQTASALIPITFSDAGINSGATTPAFLEVRASNAMAPDNQVVQFVSLRFDDINATLRNQINAKIRKLKKRLRKARQSGNAAKVQRIRKQIKREQRKLRALR